MVKCYFVIIYQYILKEYWYVMLKYYIMKYWYIQDKVLFDNKNYDVI